MRIIFLFLFFSTISLSGSIKYRCTPIELPDTKSEVEQVYSLTDQGSVLGVGFKEYDFFSFIWSEEKGTKILDDEFRSEKSHLDEVKGLNNSGSLIGLIDEGEGEETKTRGFVRFQDRTIFLDSLGAGNLVPLAINDRDELILVDGKQDLLEESDEYYLWSESEGLKKLNFKNKPYHFFRGFNDRQEILFQNLKKGSVIIVKKNGAQRVLKDQPGNFVIGMKLNGKGDVLGCVFSQDELPGYFSGIIWLADGKKIEIKEKGASIEFNDFNSSLQVIGTHLVEVNDEIVKRQAVVWDSKKGFSFLDDLVESHPGIDFKDALKINDRGQIIVEGRDSEDKTHLFLLTPLDDYLSGV